DARMLLLMGQAAEAQQILENMESEVSELPPQWMDQFKALKREVRDKKLEMERVAPPPKWTADYDGQTAEITARFPEPYDATRVVGSVDVPPVPRVDVSSKPPAGAAAETPQFASSTTTHDVLYPRGEARPAEEVEVAPELREFLEPASSTWSRPAVWVGIAVVVLVGVVVWMMRRPGAESTASPAQTVASSSYAEINAEPWSTVTAVSPANGAASSAVGQTTPLRV